MRTTDDKSAGYFDTDAPELPVEASVHMKNQVSVEAPPIEDEKYVPASPKELGLAAQLIAEKVPADQIEKFYKAALDLLEDCVVKSKNSPENLYLEDEEELKRPIIVQKESKKRVTRRLVDYIIYEPSKKGVHMLKESKKPGMSKKELEMMEDEVEFHPDAADLIDFMQANDETDAANVYGATEETAAEANKEYSLTDILKSKVFPKAGRESAIHNKIERDMFQTLRMTDSAPQVSDRLQSLVNSDFAIDAFLDSMYHADLLSDESLAELEANPEAVKSSSLYRYFTSIAFVRPTVKELERLAALGPDVFDFKTRRSQISPMDAKTIIKSVKDAWGRKSAKQRSNIAIKATRNMGEFEDRDTSVMG